MGFRRKRKGPFVDKRCLLCVFNKKTCFGVSRRLATTPMRTHRYHAHARTNARPSILSLYAGGKAWMRDWVGVGSRVRAGGRLWLQSGSSGCGLFFERVGRHGVMRR